MLRQPVLEDFPSPLLLSSGVWSSFHMCVCVCVCVCVCIYIFFFFGYAACGILVPWPGIELMLPAMEVLHPNHWTAREVPSFHESEVFSSFQHPSSYIQDLGFHCSLKAELLGWLRWKEPCHSGLRWIQITQSFLTSPFRDLGFIVFITWWSSHLEKVRAAAPSYIHVYYCFPR